MSTTISQFSCLSSVNRKLHLQRRSILRPSFRFKLSTVMSLEGHGIETSSSENKTTLSSITEASKSHIEETAKSYPTIGEHVAGKVELTGQVQEDGVTQQIRAAKIHDFCFGIPFGGLVLGGGFFGFIFSRNLATLSSGVLFGGALLALSTFSLKIWRQGKSSLPFILGQAGSNSSEEKALHPSCLMKSPGQPEGVNCGQHVEQSLHRLQVTSQREKGKAHLQIHTPGSGQELPPAACRRFGRPVRC